MSGDAGDTLTGSIELDNAHFGGGGAKATFPGGGTVNRRSSPGSV